MTQSSDRLDRVERILEQTATRLNQVADNQINLDQRLNQFATNQIELQQSMARTDQKLEAVITETSSMIGQLIQETETERQNIAALREEAAQDRQQAAIDRQEFRTEIRRIWEYLRDRNGGSSAPA